MRDPNRRGFLVDALRYLVLAGLSALTAMLWARSGGASPERRGAPPQCQGCRAWADCRRQVADCRFSTTTR